MPNLTGKAANQVVTHGDLGPLAYYSADQLTAATAQPILIARDEKSAGTNGGTVGTASWTTRTLNTVPLNTIAGASLAANQISLPPGTYDVIARAPCGRVCNQKARLYNATGAAVLLVGSSGVGAAASQNTDSSIWGRFTLAVTSAVQVEHWMSGISNSQDGGCPTNATGTVEVYSEIMFRKVGS